MTDNILLNSQSGDFHVKPEHFHLLIKGNFDFFKKMSVGETHFFHTGPNGEMLSINEENLNKYKSWLRNHKLQTLLQ